MGFGPYGNCPEQARRVEGDIICGHDNRRETTGEILIGYALELGDPFSRPALPMSVKMWFLYSLRDKLVKMGAR